jgi:hypothetical protein
MNDKKPFDMDEQIAVGVVGEKIVTDWIKKNKTFKSLTDVSKIKKYQDIDVDLKLELPNGAINLIEIKTDKYNPINFVPEEWSDNPKTDEFGDFIEDGSSGSLGCFRKTKANFIYYYFLKTDELYIFRTSAFQEWFETERFRFKRVTITNKGWAGSIRIVPVEVMMKELGPNNIKKYTDIKKDL